jgi:hypothetical protein
MRRSKIVNMTAFEEVQFRLLQMRRLVRRQIRFLDCVDRRALSDVESVHVDIMRAAHVQVIARTKPAFVRMAPFSMLVFTLREIAQILEDAADSGT